MGYFQEVCQITRGPSISHMPVDIPFNHIKPPYYFQWKNTKTMITRAAGLDSKDELSLLFCAIYLYLDAWGPCSISGIITAGSISRLKIRHFWVQHFSWLKISEISVFPPSEAGLSLQFWPSPSGNLLHSYAKWPIYRWFAYWTWGSAIAIWNYKGIYLYLG